MAYFRVFQPVVYEPLAIHSMSQRVHDFNKNLNITGLFLSKGSVMMVLKGWSMLCKVFLEHNSKSKLYAKCFGEVLFS